MLGCTPCAADCGYRPEDGFIGARCSVGHCVAYDARDFGAARCDAEEGCRFANGLDCCPTSCDPSKFVAINENFDLLCDDARTCTTTQPYCGPSNAAARCVDGTCVLRTP